MSLLRIDAKHPADVSERDGSMTGDSQLSALLEIVDSLRELAALVDAAYRGEYTIDSLTTQPAHRALAALFDAMKSESTHVQFAESETVWQSSPLDTSDGGCPFVELREEGGQ